MVKARNDLTGKQFGRLIVIKQANDCIYSNGDHIAQWLCKCNCRENTEIITTGYNLLYGRTKSCGCLRREESSNRMMHRTYDSVSGVKGIRFIKNTNKWVARIWYNGKYIYIGTYNCFEDAVREREKVKTRFNI